MRTQLSLICTAVSLSVSLSAEFVELKKTRSGFRGSQIT